MGKRKREKVYLSQLEAIQTLRPGAVRAPAEFRPPRSNSTQLGPRRRSPNPWDAMKRREQEATGLQLSTLCRQLKLTS